ELGQVRAEVYVMGFRTRAPTADGQAMAGAYETRWGEPPGIYFFETVAALQVAASWLRGNRRYQPIETVLGPLAFDPRGESHPRRFACFYLAEGRLVELQ